LRFEVNGQTYALHFDREKERWYLVTSAANGRMKAIAVVNDDEIGVMPTMVVPIDGGQAATN
jgi:hypothetical protein